RGVRPCRGGMRRDGGRIEWLPKRERRRARPRATQLLQPVDGLLERWNMAGRHPPQDEKWFIHMLKPVTPSAQEVEMLAAIYEIPQLLARLPDAEVDDDAIA